MASLLFALGAVVLTRHRASGAADLAALAAAGRAESGEGACGAAEVVATEMGARVTGCRFDGWDALVEVEADVPGGWGAVSAHARAGPVARRTASAAVNGATVVEDGRSVPRGERSPPPRG
ncbi:secretion/DNA translocation related TadE-like protein [Amycolatopsis bartoniae]|uniref:Rv3654c family TadE-like protein n=1 Tax=Amycolatopsis bartoniae TaxID=941986 RepID=UPI00184F26C2|nr:secretion/DNA translocation related TadE-like protein [Amycolatopsis bartoniae]